MKKSEKIEIRISYDEKEKLTRLAESEGQSVSELVRGLAEKYAELNMPRPRPRISRLHMLGLVLCGLGLGTGATMSLMNNGPQKIAHTTFMVHGVIDGYGFGFPVPQDDGEISSVTLGEGDGAFKINVAINPDGDQRKVAAVNICRLKAQSCEPSADADLPLSGGLSPSVWQTDVEEKDLFLVVQPLSG